MSAHAQLTAPTETLRRADLIHRARTIAEALATLRTARDLCAATVGSPGDRYIDAYHAMENAQTDCAFVLERADREGILAHLFALAGVTL